jgi:thiosulfate reductase cytochrome b subunit
MPPTSSSTPPPNDPKVQLYTKHSLVTRALHWLNVVAMGALIATGIAMMIGGDRLESIGASIHEVFYFLLFAVGAVYLASLIAGGGWKTFVPTRETLADAVDVVKSEFGRGSHAPRLLKYNGAQRLAYAAVLLMVAGEVVTGLAMAYHEQLPWLSALLGGRHTVHAIHKLLMFGIIAFAIVHVAQVIRAGWPSFLSMISGYSMIPAGSSAAVDGAIPEPDRLGAPVAQSAARKTVDARTRQGFMGAASAAAAGLILLAIGGLREAGAEGTPRRRRSGEGEGESENDERGAAGARGSTANRSAATDNRATAPDDGATAGSARARARRDRTGLGGGDGAEGEGDDGGSSSTRARSGADGRSERTRSTDRNARERSVSERGDRERDGDGDDD